MGEPALTDVIERCPGTLARRLLGDLLLLPPSAAEPVRVTSPAPVLWQILAEPTTLGDLASVLAEVHGTSADVVATDILPVIDHLVDIGALGRQRQQ